MKIRNIHTNIQMKVRRYIEYMHDEEKNGSQKGENLYKSLSMKLRNEMNVDIFFKILNEIPIFKRIFSKSFLENLSKVMKECTLAPDEHIYYVIFF